MKAQENYTEPKEILRKISEKTKSFRTVSPVSILAEILCYLIFVSMVVLAIYLPDYLGSLLDKAEDEIGFYILEPDDRESWSLLLRITILAVSFFPLTIGILLRALSEMRKRLYAIHRMTKISV